MSVARVNSLIPVVLSLFWASTPFILSELSSPHPMTIAETQATEDVYFGETWRKGGATRIQQQRLIVLLDKQSPSFHAVIKDSAGNSRYTLLIEPYYFVRNVSGGWELRKETPVTDSSDVYYWRISLLEPGEDVSLLLVELDQPMSQKNGYSSLDPIEDDWWKVGT